MKSFDLKFDPYQTQEKEDADMKEYNPVRK